MFAVKNRVNKNFNRTIEVKVKECLTFLRELNEW